LKKEFSFCEQKEAKKLYHFASLGAGAINSLLPPKFIKSFCCFFQKEDFLLPLNFPIGFIIIPDSHLSAP